LFLAQDSPNLKSFISTHLKDFHLILHFHVRFFLFAAFDETDTPFHRKEVNTEMAGKPESTLKPAALSKVIPDAVALELRSLWSPEAAVTRTEAFRRIAAQYVNGLTETEAKRLLADELAFVAEQELAVAERSRRKTNRKE